MSLAILLPTIYRKEGLIRTIRSIKKTTQFHDYDIFIICEKDDTEAMFISQNEEHCYCTTCPKELQGPAYAWNVGLAYSETIKQYDLYFLANDDDVFCDYWLDNAEKYIKRGYGLVGVNDKSGKFERAGFATHFLMTRDFVIDHNGGVVACPHYPVDFVDLELTMRGNNAGEFVYASEAVVKHLWRQTEDEAYKRADTRRKEARLIYLNRVKNNFPNDWKPIIK